MFAFLYAGCLWSGAYLKLETTRRTMTQTSRTGGTQATVQPDFRIFTGETAQALRGGMPVSGG